MGECESIRNKELYTGHKPISLKVSFQVMKSICKIIIIKSQNKINFGTGFFMKISDIENYLITNNHIISQEIVDKYMVELEINTENNQKRIRLNFDNRKIKYFGKVKDTTIIEIKQSDEIYNDVIFLEYDYNYKKGYDRYKNFDVFSIQHPLGGDAACASGRIIDINDFEFDHSIPTNNGSSGCPIILYTDNINMIQVIGIHKESHPSKQLNGGTFIGEIFNDIDGGMFDKLNNYIIAELFIKENDINEDIRIINSYEEEQRNIGINHENNNEKEIKNCEIRINDKLISFNYFHKFKIKGKYIIKYSFNDYLTNTSYMFSNCSSLTNIDLSNFNTQNVINMSYMFNRCNTLTNIDLSIFNTQNVTYMSGMFSGCNSLTNIDDSLNFKFRSVEMDMFSGCNSLIKKYIIN